MLKDMFERQAALNKRIGYDTKALRNRFDPVAAGKWLNDYIIAAGNELEELRDCTFWKHWCTEAKEGKRVRPPPSHPHGGPPGQDDGGPP